MLLVARKADKLIETIKYFEDAGYSCLGLPIVETIPQATIIIPNHINAIVLTSASAVASLPKTDIPCFCVGSATAQQAHLVGLNVVYSGGGNSMDLAKWLLDNIPPQNLLHPTTDKPNNLWYKLLQDNGFTLNPVYAYQTVYIDKLPHKVVCCLKENKVSYTLIFSTQAGEKLLSLLDDENLSHNLLKNIIAGSSTIANTFKNRINNIVYTTQKPNTKEMLHVLEQSFGKKR